MRREAELVDIDVLRRFVDAPLEQILGLQFTYLGADESEHDGLSLRHETQRRETARTHVVVFQEITVDRQFVEQHLRHRFVAAFRSPGAAEIAAAQMHAYGHVRRPVGNRSIDQPGVAAR